MPPFLAKLARSLPMETPEGKAHAEDVMSTIIGALSERTGHKSNACRRKCLAMLSSILGGVNEQVCLTSEVLAKVESELLPLLHDKDAECRQHVVSILGRVYNEKEVRARECGVAQMCTLASYAGCALELELRLEEHVPAQ